MLAFSRLKEDKNVLTPLKALKTDQFCFEREFAATYSLLKREI